MMKTLPGQPARSTAAKLRLILTGLAAGAAIMNLSCLNPDLVNQTAGGLYPLAPGDQPFVLLTMINQTNATLSGTILVDQGATTPVPIGFTNFLPEVKTRGVLLPYPFLRVALGSLDNPFTPTISATLPTGVTVQVPFGHPALVAGTDFKKGDTILFEFVADARSPEAISVATGRIDGSTQTGPFSRSDTFLNVTGILLLNGLNTGFLTSPAAP